jgi:hypothetical protein
LASFHFHASAFQVSTFQVSAGKIQLCKFSAETKAYFLIVFICVISAQVTSNVWPLGDVAD